MSSSSSDSSDDLSEEFGRLLDDDELRKLHEELSSKPMVEHFPDHLRNPSAPVSRDHRHAYRKSRNALEEGRDHVHVPMASQLELNFSLWAKLRGPSSSALTELPKIDGVGLFPDFRSESALTSIVVS